MDIGNIVLSIVIVFFLLVIVFFIIADSKRIQKEEEEEKLREQKRLEEQAKQRKIDDIASIILADNHFEDIENVFGDEPFDLEVLKRGFDQAVDAFLDDDFLSEKEEKRLLSFKNYFRFKQIDLDENGFFQRVLLASLLRTIKQDKTIPEYTGYNKTPFILTKKEKLIWIFADVLYLEDGKNKGQDLCLDLSKNAITYLSTSVLKGKYIEPLGMNYISKGFLGVTDKNLYYHSTEKSFKIPYSKIVSTNSYENGIRIHKDGVTTKAQTFYAVDSWFILNLISILNNME